MLRTVNRALADTNAAFAKLFVVNTELLNVERQLTQTTALLDVSQKSYAKVLIQLANAKDALKRAERHREQLLSLVVRNGDPGGVAEAINRELKALANLGKPS